MAIRELNAPKDLGLQPSDRAMEATTGAGRRIAGLYGQAAEAEASAGRSFASGGQDLGGEVVKYMEHREISAGAATAATLFSGLDSDWNAKIKDPNFDPNDASAKAQWTEQTLEPRLEKLREAFNTEGGQKYAEAQIEQFRTHFNQKTSADMATMAGIAVRSNINTLTNQLTNMAINDPSSVKASLGMIEHSIGAMVDSSPTLSGVAAAKVKEDLLGASQAAIVKAAAIGAINANPEAGLKEFSSEKYSKYISGVELKQLETQANTVKRAARIEENYALQTQKMQKQDASDTREGEYLVKMHSDNPKDRESVSAKAIAGDFTLTREARERMISMADRSTKPETDAKISRATSVELFNYMRQDNTDPVKLKNKIDDEYAAGKLTWGDRTALIKEVEDRKTPEGLALAQDRGQFFKQYAGAIAGRMYDPIIGSPKLYAAERDARRVEQDLKQRGLDPHLAYDPTSDYFLGKKVQKWSGSMQGDLGAKAAVASDGALPEPLRGIASLSYLPDRQMYQDDTTGALYNRSGEKVADRPLGVYKTPKGELRWTGTGWVKP